jgi:glycosyltransferase involved in cell wall biosynthesis
VKLSRKASGQVVFMPYLDEDELLDKYQSSRLLVMPSLVEGLSLPILEAWSNGLVAIGSKGTVAEELIKTDSLLFDPLNSLELSNCIKLLLTSEDYWNNALKLSMVSARIFTWKETARIVLKAIESLGDD